MLAEIGIVAVGSNTECLEQVPSSDPDNPHPVHAVFLIEHGIHIMESVLTIELVKDGEYEFLFVPYDFDPRDDGFDDQPGGDSLGGSQKHQRIIIEIVQFTQITRFLEAWTSQLDNFF